MFHSCDFEFKKPALMKKGVGVKNVYSAIASTASIDRHKEILVPRGVMTERFMANPVMLNIHNHREYPVGRVLNISVDKDFVKMDFEFADSANGQELEKLYNSGVMNAFSVGFIPKNYIDLLSMTDDTGKLNVNSLEVELPNGEKELIDFTKYTETPYGIISKWELLEISPVPIPANPDALMIRAKDEIVRKFIDAGNSKAAASLLEDQLLERISEIKLDLEVLLEESEQGTVLSNAVPYDWTKVNDVAWDSEEARAALVLWACTDKERIGDSEVMDWAKFSKGFAWVDLDRADKFISYKLTHHTIVDNELCVVPKGVFEAMAELLADKTQYKDAEEVYEHLVGHYLDLEMPPPEFKDYTEEELAKIKVGDVTVSVSVSEVCEPMDSEDSEDSTGTENSMPMEEMKSFISSSFEKVENQIRELEDTVRLRMNILGKMFDELHKELIAAKSKPEVQEEDSQEAKLFAEKLNDLSSLFEDIRIQ